jgi:hypothetical protein
MPEEATTTETTTETKPVETTTETKPVETETKVEAEKVPAGYVPIRALQDERTKRQTLEGQLEAERQARVTAPKPEPKAEPKVTVETVIGAYQKGEITEAQKDQYLYGIAVRDAEERAVTRTRETTAADRSRNEALTDINGYLAAKPSLNDTSSEEYQKVATTFQKFLARGLPNNEATKAAALAAALGPLESLTAKTQLKERTREPGGGTFTERSDGTHVEDGGKSDPLKHVDKEQIAYWQRMGYSKKDMENEAKYYRPHRRGARA